MVKLGKCKVNEHRPCELNIGLLFAQDLGKEVNIATPEIDTIIERGEADEKEVKNVLRKFKEKVPVTYEGRPTKSIADEIFCSVFPEECGRNDNKKLKEGGRKK